MGAKEVWVPISSTNTRPEGSMLPTSVRHRLLKNSSLSAAPLDLFSAPAKGSYRPADRRFAHRNPRDGEQELGPLGVGGPRSPFEVFYEQLAGLLAQLRSLAWGLRRLQGAALVELLAVAFDRSAIDPEAAGGLGFGDALFHRFDYLLSKVQRVCSHVSTIPGATSTQPAVRGWRVLPALCIPPHLYALPQHLGLRVACWRGAIGRFGPYRTRVIQDRGYEFRRTPLSTMLAE